MGLKHPTEHHLEIEPNLLLIEKLLDPHPIKYLPVEDAKIHLDFILI